MVKVLNGAALKKPQFKTVFYQDVELFVHRDTTQKPAKLRLYDALSGWVVASQITKAEADSLGLTNHIEGRSEAELLQILENKVNSQVKNGESFKKLLIRLRKERPPGEQQQAITKAYANEQANIKQPQSIAVTSERKIVRMPVTKTITKVATGDLNQERKVVMPEIQQQKRRCNLVLHCGANAVERVEVARVSTPRPTDTWSPIPHVTLIEEVEGALRSTGLTIGNQVHSLGYEGNRYFGLMEILSKETASDYSLVLGIRNSHDKTFPVGLVAGASVFVCDNLSFSGEVRISRKHTVHLQRDMPQLVSRGVGRLMDLWGHQGKRIEAYKNTRVKDRVAHDLVIRAVDLGACTNRMIPTVLKEWRTPTYPAFGDRTAWSLFNAFTEALKGNLPELPNRTEALHGLMDSHVGLPAAHLN